MERGRGRLGAGCGCEQAVVARRLDFGVGVDTSQLQAHPAWGWQSSIQTQKLETMNLLRPRPQ